jgi:hypothetical protein
MLPTMTLPLVSTVVCYLFLESDHKVALAWEYVPMLCINVSVTTLAIALRPSMLEKTKNTLHSIVFALPGFMALLSQRLGLPVFLSYVQLLAFVVSICCCAFVVCNDPESGHSSKKGWLELPLVVDDTEHPGSSIDNLKGHGTEAQKRWPLAQTIFLFIATIIWFHFFPKNFSPPFQQSNMHELRLDASYTLQHRHRNEHILRTTLPHYQNLFFTHLHTLDQHKISSFDTLHKRLFRKPHSAATTDQRHTNDTIA